MNYFKNEYNKIFAYDDLQIQKGYGFNLTPITEEEKNEILISRLKEKTIVDYKIDVYNLYDSAMRLLESKYPQTEINTFARKSVAANDFIENNKNAKDSNIYLLAKIDAVVNGTSPLSMEEISEEIENINDSGWETIQDRAIKILSAEHQYDFYLAKIEQMRNSALDQLSETEDNTSIVESLTEAYKQLEG